jgi:RNA polymerase sigma-70 factor (ECF subfamily)
MSTPTTGGAYAHSSTAVGANEVGTTDWRQIVLLYDRLLAFQPTVLVRLNRCALVEAEALRAALAKFDALSDELDGYRPFHAARAEVLRLCGNVDGASAALCSAIELSRSLDEQRWLAARRGALF